MEQPARRRTHHRRQPKTSCTNPWCSKSRSSACWPTRARKRSPTNFAVEWLHLQNLKGVNPDLFLFPDFDRTLTNSMRRETELLFDSMMREDRNVTDLLTANYTFVDERLAKHYGIPNVMGNRFRRVTLTDPNRFGLLGHGSILTLTSYRHPHFARAARQIGDGSAARHAAASAAAQRARAARKLR